MKRSEEYKFTCLECKCEGTVLIEPGTGVYTHRIAVEKAHAQINPECGNEFGGTYVNVTGMNKGIAPTIESFIREIQTHYLEESPMECMNSLVGELGELANVFKKHRFYQSKEMPEYKERVDKEVADGTRQSFKEQMTDEAGDTLFYFLKLLDVAGITINDIMAYHLVKLANQDKDLGRKFLK